MDIHQFLELFVGRWRSQRSDHQFSKGNGSDSRSVLEITRLGFDDPDLISICQKHNIAPDQTIKPVRISWEEESLSNKKPNGSNLFVPVPNAANALHKGLILGNQSKGIYELGLDEAMTIQTRTAQGEIVERIWYGNPNLRFRVATLITGAHDGDKLVQSSKFYSEIRMAPPKA